MHLINVYIRFYKSFNFDYLKKFKGEGTQQPWELIDDMWYPHVRIPINRSITTVVGANESGKSHLLGAIEKGIEGKSIKPEDFCRYSQFFSGAKGSRKFPEFGLEWDNITSREQVVIREVCGLDTNTLVPNMILFRIESKTFKIFIPNSEGYQTYELNEAKTLQLEQILPKVLKIDADVALPDSVPILALAGEESTSSFERAPRSSRYEWQNVLRSWLDKRDTIQNEGKVLAHFDLVQPPQLEKKQEEKRQKQIALARSLICDVAEIDPMFLHNLNTALKEGNDGYASAIIRDINKNLARKLNFPSWWVQDRSFQLIVSARDLELAFTIRDRTGTEYSFSERSQGLKYFLSYYVQYRVHTPLTDGSEILLMDEPDAYLSAQAQQDLLKIFDAFAYPDDGSKAVQVIYVTHSPFLIDKNHAERIRVLEKGVNEEGTRVVRDVSRNHYEPLRSAFGAYVGETTFIGHSNLMLEGVSDQILIAGMVSHLRKKGTSDVEVLDLNKITLVPSGGASEIPYLVYLARGRDTEKPAVLVLLDSDKAGNEAAKKLKQGPYNGKKIIDPAYVLQIGDLSKELTGSTDTKLIDLEELIPMGIVEESARHYGREVCNAPPEAVKQITTEVIRAGMTSNKGIFKALQTAFTEKLGSEYHIEKSGFVRSVLDVVASAAKEVPDSELATSLEVFETNMKVLFRNLNSMKQKAEEELFEDRASQKVDRLKSAFFQDYPVAARRENALMLLNRLESAVESDVEGDKIRFLLADIRRNHKLEEELTEPITEYAQFKLDLERVKYAPRLESQEHALEELSLPNP